MAQWRSIGFSNSCVASLTKQLFDVIISVASFTGIFNHWKYSLNTPYKAFRHVTTARERRRSVCEVRNRFYTIRVPSPLQAECHSKSTNRSLYITLAASHSKLSKEPQPSYGSITTDTSVLRRCACPNTTLLHDPCDLRHSCYAEPAG